MAYVTSFVTIYVSTSSKHYIDTSISISITIYITFLDNNDSSNCKIFHDNIYLVISNTVPCIIYCTTFIYM